MKYLMLVVLVFGSACSRTEPKVNFYEFWPGDGKYIYTMKCKHVQRPNGELFYAMAYVKVDRYTGEEVPITVDEVKMIDAGKLELQP